LIVAPADVRAIIAFVVALIESAEDLADIRAAQLARDEISDGAEPIPWEQVKVDLGLA
jgi:hypothetical protein